MHSLSLTANLTLDYIYGTVEKVNVKVWTVVYVLFWMSRFSLVFITWQFVKQVAWLYDFYYKACKLGASSPATSLTLL